MTVDEMREMFRDDPDGFYEFFVNHTIMKFANNTIKEYLSMYKLVYINSHTMMIQVNTKDVKIEKELILN